jgi:methionyl aminopeptidase
MSMRRRTQPTPKSPADIEKMRRAAGVVEDVLTMVAEQIGPGVKTSDLNRQAEEHIASVGGRPLFKGYEGGPGVQPFPYALCVSLNDVVVHGFPSDVPLEEGDIVSVDCGVELDGWCGDFAYTFPIGVISEEKTALLRATKQSLYEGIAKAVVGNRVGDIGHAVQTYCESRGYGVVTALVGHGLGQSLHEPPQVPNVGRRGNGKRLRDGYTLCIEPMINAGTPEVTVDADGWTIRTADRRPAAHFEHTVHVRRGQPAELLSSYDRIEAALAKNRGETVDQLPTAIGDLAVLS